MATPTYNIIVEKEKYSETNVSLAIDTHEYTHIIEENTVNKASWSSCFANLISTIIGAGILGLPHGFAQTGWILGMVMLTLCATASAFALHLLSICSKKVSPPSSFYAVAEIALPQMSWIIDAVVAIKCYGVATSYLIVVGDLMPTAMKELHAYGIWQARTTWILFGFAIVAPLSCFKSLDALKWASGLSLIFVAFLTVVVVLYTFPVAGLSPCSDGGVDCVGSQLIGASGFQSIKALPIFIFGYTCQQNIFSIVNELKDSSQARVDSVIRAAVGVAWSTYAIVAACGYLTYGVNMQSDLLRTYPTAPLITASRMFVSAVVMCHYPLQANPARKSLLSLVQHCSGGAELSTLRYRVSYVAITATFLISSLAIALSVNDLGIVLSVVGATGSTMVCYILPGIFYFNLHRHEGPAWKRWLALAQFLLGVVIMPVCLVLVFYS